MLSRNGWQFEDDSIIQDFLVEELENLEDNHIYLQRFKWLCGIASNKYIEITSYMHCLLVYNIVYVYFSYVIAFSN